MNMKNVLLFAMPILFLTSCAASRTPTPALNFVSDNLKSKAAQIKLTLEDMPDHFVNLDSESNRMIGEENLLDIQSAFSFHSDAGNLEKIIGMTTVYPYSQRDPSDGMDRIRQQIELVTRSMVKGFVFARDVDVEDLVFNKPIGDVYSGKTFAWSNGDVGYPNLHTRTEILVFERDKITVMLFLQYVEELPVSLSIETEAEKLDAQIQNLDP